MRRLLTHKHAKCKCGRASFPGASITSNGGVKVHTAIRRCSGCSRLDYDCICKELK